MRDKPVAVAAPCTAHNKHKRRILVSSAGFESGIPAIKWRQTYALAREATRISIYLLSGLKYLVLWSFGCNVWQKVEAVCSSQTSLTADRNTRRHSPSNRYFNRRTSFLSSQFFLESHLLFRSAGNSDRQNWPHTSLMDITPSSCRQKSRF